MDEMLALLQVRLSPFCEILGGRIESRHSQGCSSKRPARGRLVDTQALMRALEPKRIRAALDVTDPEPLPDGHPLWTMEGVLITPHIGGAVVGMYDRAWRLVAEQLQRYVNGEPLRNVVRHGY